MFGLVSAAGNRSVSVCSDKRSEREKKGEEREEQADHNRGKARYLLLGGLIEKP